MPKGQVAGYVSNFTKYLQGLIPERFEGELSWKVQKFFDPSNNTILQQTFEIVAFLCSNNLLNDEQIKNFVEWIIKQKCLDSLKSFLQINTPTIHSFSESIVKPCISLQDTVILKQLLSWGVKFDNSLTQAFSICDIDFLKDLLSKVDASCLSGEKGGKLLYKIAGTDFLEIAQTLVQNGAEINGSFGFNDPPLHQAVNKGNLEMTKFLLNSGANPNLYSRNGSNTALGIASCFRQFEFEIVSILLDHGANIEGHYWGNSILDYCAVENWSMYKFLLTKTGKLEDVHVGTIIHTAKRGSSVLADFLNQHKTQISQRLLEEALYESLNRGNIPAATALLKNGVDPDGPTLDYPPIMVADLQLCQLLVASGANVNAPGLLNNAIEIEDLELLEFLIDKGADLEESGPIALEKALISGNVEAAALLIDGGTDINSPGEVFTSLQAAACSGKLELVKYLMDQGADVNSPASPLKGRTALQAACEVGKVDVVQYLLDNGSDVNAPPALTEGLTALEAAAKGHYTKSAETIETIFRLLLRLGASPKRQGGSPSGILHSLMRKGLLDLIPIIVDAGAGVDEMLRGKEGRTPLQLAAEIGDIEAVKTLKECGANVNARPSSRHGRTALQAATCFVQPRIDIVEYLIKNDAHINAPPAVSGGITALQGAAIRGHINIAKFLLDAGAEVNAAPAVKDGRTAIEGAAEHGRLDMVQLLLSCGAKGDVVRKTGFKTAIELAEKNGHLVIANLLRAASK
jgi:ankyrin repeat protein